MRYAVLADIHANLQALEAVCADVRRAGAERMLCLGDIVGYGADPRECLQMVRDLNATIVAGNHDVLREGMAFSVEPGVYFAGDWGARIEDIVIVTSDGCEPVNTRPHHLVILPG